MKKLQADSVINKCGDCSKMVIKKPPGLMIDFYEPYLYCWKVLDQVDPDKIHPKCPLLEVEVIKLPKKEHSDVLINIHYNEQRFWHDDYDEIEKVIIVRKAKE
jgi:hypothetical protein